MKNILFAISIFLIASGLYSQSSFSSDRIEDAIIQFAKSQLEGDIEISLSKTIEDQIFEQGGIEAEFVADTNFLGDTFVKVIFKKENDIINTLNVAVSVKLFKKITIAKTTIPEGTIVDARNLSFTRVDVTNYDLSQILKATEVIGKEAKKTIIAGKPFLKEHFTDSKLVSRGDMVEIQAVSGAVKVRTTGTALNDAAAGDKIRVRRSNSTSVITAILSEDGIAIISGSTPEYGTN